MKLFLRLISISIFLSIANLNYAQGQWDWYAGLQHHIQFNKSITKNLVPSGALANSPRKAFSTTEGAGIILGLSKKNDSSNLVTSIGLQHIWGTLVTMGFQADTAIQKSELIQSTQTNLKLGVGYINPGRYKYSFQLGPIIPVWNKSVSSIYYFDNTNEFTAFYDSKFKTSIGLWLEANYQVNLNSKIEGFAGLGVQLLNRKIKSRKLTKFEQSKGNLTQANYAPNTYQQEYVFLSNSTSQMNDAITNPSGVDFNKPREIQTQSYSFSSMFIQVGIKYKLF